MKLLQLIMLGIHWFTPKCTVREVIHKKNNHYLYVTKHFDDGVIEMWAHASKDFKSIFKKDKYFLGKVMGQFWGKPKNYYELDRSMIRNAEWLYHKLQGQNIDLNEVKVYGIKDMKKKFKEKRVYTREDFVNFGKLGQEKVKEKYKVRNAVLLRWKTKKEVIHK